ncbi:MAG: response regulator [Devosia sp.]|nr:response regulator [Devosia sp.]
MLRAVSVLVADPSTYLAGLTASMLKGVGIHAVASVNDSAAVLLALHRTPFDVLVLDDQMLPIDGITLARQIRAEGGERRFIPIVMVFAEADRRRIETARDAGVTEFIRKPMSAKLLEQRIAQALEHPRPFIEADVYTGPDRRRRDLGIDGGDRRQGEKH